MVLVMAHDESTLPFDLHIFVTPSFYSVIVSPLYAEIESYSFRYIILHFLHS